MGFAAAIGASNGADRLGSDWTASLGVTSFASFVADVIAGVGCEETGYEKAAAGVALIDEPPCLFASSKACLRSSAICFLSSPS